jgi:hypothetical protein
VLLPLHPHGGSTVLDPLANAKVPRPTVHQYPAGNLIPAEYADHTGHRPHRALGQASPLGPGCQLPWRRLRGSRDEIGSVS